MTGSIKIIRPNAEKPNMKLCSLILVFCFYTHALAQASVNCDQTMKRIDTINEMQLSQRMGDGQTMRDLLASHSLASLASSCLYLLQEKYRKAQGQGEKEFRLGSALYGIDSCKKSKDVLAKITPACADWKNGYKACSETLGPIVAQGSLPLSPALVKLQEESSMLQERLEDLNREDKKVKALSIVKKKLAQDYVLACDLKGEDEAQKLQIICGGGAGVEGEEALASLTADNMKIVGFMSVAQSAIDDERLKKACDSLSEQGVTLKECGASDKARAPGSVSKRSSGPEQEESAEDIIQRNLEEQESKRLWSKIGKIAAYTALAGGAIAVGAWAIGKLGGDSGSSSDVSKSASHSGTLVPASYRSSMIFPNYMPYGNMNYSHYYAYPNSFGSAWVGEQSFDKISPYSIENTVPAQTSGGLNDQSFKFGF